MNVSSCKQFLEMQTEALDYISYLINFDREQAEQVGGEAEKTISLKAFVETQKKALVVLGTLLEKHQEKLEELEKQKREEEAKKYKEAKKQKAEQAKQEAELKAEATPKQPDEEGNLFSTMGEDVKEEVK